MLRQRIELYNTPLLGYCLTSNHVHLLVTATSETNISQFMDALEGDFAQQYNIRKKRSGSFWAGRYHATAVEDHLYLWNCLLYIDLNMVRAGVVGHPTEWSWCSYGELIGSRKRYRLIDQDHFEDVVGQHPDSETFRANYTGSIEQRISSGDEARRDIWTESLAVGSERYVQRIAEVVNNRRALDTEQIADPGSDGWVLKESRPAYA